MSSRVEVARRVAPSRGVTASDVTAFAAQAQRHPPRSFPQAVFASIWSCWRRKAGERQTDKVLTDRDGHGQSSSIEITRAVHGQKRPPPKKRAFAFDIRGTAVAHFWASGRQLRELDAPRCQLQLSWPDRRQRASDNGLCILLDAAQVSRVAEALCIQLVDVLRA